MQHCLKAATRPYHNYLFPSLIRLSCPLLSSSSVSVCSSQEHIRYWIFALCKYPRWRSYGYIANTYARDTARKALSIDALLVHRHKKPRVSERSCCRSTVNQYRRKQFVCMGRILRMCVTWWHCAAANVCCIIVKRTRCGIDVRSMITDDTPEVERFFVRIFVSQPIQVFAWTRRRVRLDSWNKYY